MIGLDPLNPMGSLETIFWDYSSNQTIKPEPKGDEELLRYLGVLTKQIQQKTTEDLKSSAL